MMVTAGDCARSNSEDFRHHAAEHRVSGTTAKVCDKEWIALLEDAGGEEGRHARIPMLANGQEDNRDKDQADTREDASTNQSPPTPLTLRARVLQGSPLRSRDEPGWRLHGYGRVPADVLQRTREGCHRLETVGRGSREGSREGTIQAQRHDVSDVSYGWRGINQTPCHDRLGITPHVGWLPSKHFVEYAGEAVHVRPSIDPVALEDLLGTHVRRGADGQSRIGKLLAGKRVSGRFRQGARQTEVRDQRVIAREQDVARLDVAVQNALCVCLVQRVGHLEGEPDRYIDRELNLSPEAVAKALALDVGHGVPELPGIIAGVEHREDVGMTVVER